MSATNWSSTIYSRTVVVLAYARTKEALVLFGEAAYTEKLQPLAKKTNATKQLIFPAGAFLNQRPQRVVD